MCFGEGFNQVELGKIESSVPKISLIPTSLELI